MEILNLNRLHLAKRAFSTRRVDLDAAKTLIYDHHRPEAGDLVLARITKIGSHKAVELPTGRKAKLYPGDEVILAYGNRYAPDQYEAYVPDDLRPCHMVAAGGIAALASSWHERLAGPTCIEPVGILGCSGCRPINLKQFGMPLSADLSPMACFAVFGTSMNAGKTISAASLVKGFADAGHRVGAVKITGTAAGGDLWLMRDSGAADVLDFTDAGFATTFGADMQEVAQAARNLLRTLGGMGCDVAVIEVADGLFQSETAQLAADPTLLSLLDGTLFAASDALGASTGVGMLQRMGHRLLGVSGAVMQSPLASKEAAEQLDVPMLHLDDLRDPGRARALLPDSQPARRWAAE